MPLHAQVLKATLTEGGDAGLAVGREAGQRRQRGEPEPDGARGLPDVARDRRGDGARGWGGDGRGHGDRCLRSVYVSAPPPPLAR